MNPADCITLCICGSTRFVCGSDLLRRVAIRPPDELRWLQWERGTDGKPGEPVRDKAGRAKWLTQAKAQRWTTAELIP